MGESCLPFASVSLELALVTLVPYWRPLFKKSYKTELRWLAKRAERGCTVEEAVDDANRRPPGLLDLWECDLFLMDLVTLSSPWY